MKRAMLALTGILFVGITASADWGSGSDIADQWGNPRHAYGGSGNPYSGGYHRKGWGAYYPGHRGHHRHHRSPWHW